MRCIFVRQRTLPEAWEKAVIRCWNEGDSFETQYDKKGDPESRDVTAMIHITEPLAEPRIHRAFPGGLEDLEKYRAEVLLGAHDYYMDDLSNPNRWRYTYSKRLFEYVYYNSECHGFGRQLINQIQKCVDMLKQCGYTRRAQAVTWKCWEDLDYGEPPCLQRLWFRVENNKLNMNVHMRSWDLYKAAFMNCYAFIELQKYVANQVGVDMGEYLHVADSAHIYGSYFDEFKGFLNMVEKRKPEDRVWDISYALPIFIEGCDALLKEENMPADKKKLIEQRKKELQNLIT